MTERASVWLLLLPLLVGCGEPPLCLEQIFVDGVRVAPDGQVQMVLRFLQDDGTPAPAPDKAALTPVAHGHPLGRFRELKPIVGSGLHLALVVDPDLPASLFEPQRQAYLQIVRQLGPADRVQLLTQAKENAPSTPPSWAPPATVAAELQSMPLPPPPAPGSPAAARQQIGGGPIGWAQAPLELLDQAITRLTREASSAPRRAVLVFVQGRTVGRIWNQVAAWASASGVDVHLVTVPPEGRTTNPGKIERPLIWYAADDLAALPRLLEQVEEGILGGYLASFQAERRGPDLVDGIGVRARLPRGGWEEFDLLPLATPPAHLLLERLQPVGTGLYRVLLRASDARGEPIKLAPGDARLLLDTQPLELATAPVQPVEPLALALLATQPTSDEEAEAMRQALRQAVGQLAPTDLAMFVMAGVVPFRPSALGTDRQDLLAAIEQFGQTRSQPARDLESDVNDLVRELQKQRTGHRLMLLILSGPRELRNSRGVGQGTYRFQAMLHLLRRQGVTPYWLARVPRGEFDVIRHILNRLAGGSLWTVSRWSELAGLTAAVVDSLSRPLALTIRSELPPDELRPRLKARFEFRGQLIESQTAALQPPADEP